MSKLKLIKLAVVAREEDVDEIAREMEKSHIAQMGFYTFDCGGVEDLADEDLDFIIDELPDWLIDELEQEQKIADQLRY